MRNRRHFPFSVTPKQASFIVASEDEVLFGGAAGGGKSYGQLIDAMIFALRYPKSKQLILRRTYAELEKSLIRESLSLYPRELYRYHTQSHVGRFANGSIIDFGYCAVESDVYQYQSAEYDVVRFDELTHFTEFQYTYLISRVRGANGYPKQVKSSTNPGGIGHAWVKSRFVLPAAAGTRFECDSGSRIFIPSLVDDNRFLMEKDARYKERLAALPDLQRRALLDGDWDVFEGQYFAEFSRASHVCEPFIIPRTWRRYRALDYGLDRLACLFIALSPEGDAYVYREICESNLIISEAVARILQATPKEEKIYATLAPPDLWHRSQESGKSKASIFAACGLPLTRTSNDREAGWLAVKELLSRSRGAPKIQLFRNCEELIRCLPQLQIDKTRPCDTMTEPHAITHAPDALRYFAIYYARPSEESDEPGARAWSEDMWEDYRAASDSERAYLETKWNRKKGKSQIETHQ